MSPLSFVAEFGICCSSLKQRAAFVRISEEASNTEILRGVILSGKVASANGRHVISMRIPYSPNDLMTLKLVLSWWLFVLDSCLWEPVQRAQREGVKFNFVSKVESKKGGKKKTHKIDIDMDLFWFPNLVTVCRDKFTLIVLNRIDLSGAGTGPTSLTLKIWSKQMMVK